MTGKRKFFFCGGVKIRLVGQDPERFLNIAAQRNLFICDVNERDGKITCWTTPKSFRAMKSIFKKTGVKSRIVKRYGLPFFIFKKRKRKLFIAGILSFFMILYMLTFYIWDITFEGNQRFTDETLLHYMETIPVVYGMKKEEISCDEIENGLRNQFSEITWVSAEIKGTRLIVRIKENEVLMKPMKKDTGACDLAARKSGKIVKTVVRSGKVQVKAGDLVESGTLLVDGTIPIYDDSETLVSSHEVHADGEIYAETVYQIKKKLSVLKAERFRTGKRRKGVFIRCFDNEFYLMGPANAESLWEYTREEYQLKVLKDFLLPVYVGILQANEYDVYEKVYTKEEAFSVCRQSMMEYMEKLSEKGVQILGNDGKIERGESGWLFTGTITVIEDIAKEVPIPEKQEEIQTVNECN